MMPAKPLPGGRVTRFVKLVPVDAHIAPWYPVSIFKPSFRVTVKRTPFR